MNERPYLPISPNANCGSAMLVCPKTSRRILTTRAAEMSAYVMRKAAAPCARARTTSDGEDSAAHASRRRALLLRRKGRARGPARARTTHLQASAAEDARHAAREECERRAAVVDRLHVVPQVLDREVDPLTVAVGRHARGVLAVVGLAVHLASSDERDPLATGVSPKKIRACCHQGVQEQEEG